MASLYPAIYLITLELKQSKIFPYFFFPGTIASLAAFATRIFTTVLAGILIASPVAGLRPMRAFLFTRTSFPIPGRVKEPVFLVSDTARAATSSIIPEAILFESLKFSCKMGHDLRFGHRFLSHFGPPVGWIIKLDSGSILERGLGSKRKSL